MSGKRAVDIWREKLAFFEKELAITSDAATKFELETGIAEAQERIVELEAREESAVSHKRHAIQVSIDRLPRWDTELVGRKDELALLDDAWREPDVGIASIVAMGGIGKSALVRHWLVRMRNDNWRGARRVLGYSFYSQGSQEETEASADGFLVWALDFLGDKHLDEGSSWEKGERLAVLIRNERTLLILDGIEPLQYPPTSNMSGQLRDPGLTALLRSLADNINGLCVVTTRESLQGIAMDPTRVRQIDLPQLPTAVGVTLLRKIGVEGTDNALAEVTDALRGHALAVTLLGKYVMKAHQGQLAGLNEFTFTKADQRHGSPADRIINQYEKWFGEVPELSIMRLLGLFNRPAKSGEIATLRSEPAITGLSDAIVGMTEEDWNWAVANLRECGLLALDQGRDVLDAHPLVREHFAKQLRERHPESEREAHRRLYEFLKQSAPEYPMTLPEMMPLYHSVRHGCRAGIHMQAGLEVYLPRIARDENRHFGIYHLGAVSADLAAVSSFFDRLWDQPSKNVHAAFHGHLLLVAALGLRASNRLPEAEQAIRASISINMDREDWAYAARSGISLADLLALRGELAAAIAEFERAIGMADEADDVFWRIVARAGLGSLLHQSSQNDLALMAFDDAEAVKHQYEPENANLFGLQAFRYCEMIMDEVESADELKTDIDERRSQLKMVRDRVEATLARYHNKPAFSVLDEALSHLAVARSWALEAEIVADDCVSSPDGSSLLDSVEHHIREGLLLLKKSGRRDFMPRGLLARAALSRQRYLVSRDASQIDNAERDLAEAEEIARPSMLIWQIEIEIERLRLKLAFGDHDAARTFGRARARIGETNHTYCAHPWDWDSRPPPYLWNFKEGEVVSYRRRETLLQELQQQVDKQLPTE